jgi:hypothetical protein
MPSSNLHPAADNSDLDPNKLIEDHSSWQYGQPQTDKSVVANLLYGNSMPKVCIKAQRELCCAPTGQLRELLEEQASV